VLHKADSKPVRMVGTVKNVIERRSVESALLYQLAGIDPLANVQQFYRTCIAGLVQIYGAHFAFIGTFTGPEMARVQTRALWIGGEFTDNLEYDLKGTPCEDVLDGKIELISHGAADKYPQDRLLAEMGIDSYFGAPLIDSAGETIGIVAVLGTGPMKISPWTKPVLGVFSQRIAAATERAALEAEREHLLQDLRQALTEKEVLLRETHHRIKNNLQLISSLLRLQARKVSNPEDRELFNKGLDRVQAVALVHEILYQSEERDSIDCASCVKNLVRTLEDAHRPPNGQIKIALLLAKEISLPLDKATPCALIVSELVTNAFKHAFPEGRSGEIRIEATRTNAHLLLAIADNGVGMQDELDLQRPQSLGMQLVTDLVKQLDGVMTISNEDGLQFAIEIPLGDEAQGD